MTRQHEAGLGLIDWDQVSATVVRYDARGHGESESTPSLGGYSWAELARDQLALADALGIDRYVAGGASMGCGTALHVAVQAPERVRALLLVIPPTAWERRAAQAAQWRLNAGVIETEGVESLIAARERLELPGPYRHDEAGRREQQARATRDWDPHRLALVMRGAAIADFPDRDQVAGIQAPALVLAWTGDLIHPRSTADELTALLPDAHLEVASTAAELAGWSATVDAFLAGRPA
jgi:3-oxoadipate enol-lactonase